MKRLYQFRCCRCKKELSVRARSKVAARVYMHTVRGWYSTSIDSPTAKDACQRCAEISKCYTQGLPWKRSVFAGIGSGLGKEVRA